MPLAPRLVRGLALCVVVAAGTSVLPIAAHGALAASRTASESPSISPQPRSVADHGPLGLPTASGSVTGVILGVTGEPQSRACVIARGASTPVPAVSSADGRYLITGLRPGRYLFSYSECHAGAGYQTRWYGADTGRAVLVRPGERVTLDPVRLRPASPAALVRAIRSQRQAGSRANVTGGRISGIVRSKSGKRLAGICVEYGTRDFGSAQATGAHGAFKLEGLTPGRYELQFYSGCGNNGNFAPQWWRRSATSKKATWIRVTRKTRRTGVNAVLGTGAVIVGTVRLRTRSGRPLRGVCVYASGLGAMSGSTGGARTGRRGTYRLRGLGTGRYQVQFSPCDSKTNYLSSTFPKAVQVTDGKTVRRINGVLLPSGQIRGVVTAADHRPLSGICVVVSDDRTATEVASTSASGSYHVSQLKPGRYSVGFAGGCGSGGSYAPQAYPGRADLLAGTAVLVKVGQSRTGINAVMRPGGTLAGQVTDASGRKLSDICVVPVQAGGPYDTTSFLERLLFSLDSQTGVVESAGAYEFRNLWPGRYDVAFFECGSASHAGRWFRTQDGVPVPVSVHPGTVTSGINAVMTRGGTISGEVTEHGRNVDDRSCVVAVPRGGPAAFRDLGVSEALPRADGYRITGLAPGTYAVQVFACDGGAFGTEFYRDATGPSAATTVPVTSGTVTSGINIAVGRGGSISGRVTSRLTGRPLRHACVEVLDADPRNPGNANFVNEVQARPDGRYHVGGLGGKGRYDVVFMPCSGSALAAKVRSGVKVIAPRETSGVTAALGRAGSMSGTVTSTPRGAATASYCVDAFPVTGGGITGVGLTGTGGGYRIVGLAPGTYRIRFAACTPGPVPGAESLAAQWYRQRSSRRAATLVRVRAGTVTRGIGARMAQDGSVSGTVTTAASKPLAGICVAAIPADSGKPGAAPVLAETGRAGRYLISGVPPGSYLVEFTGGCGASGYAAHWWKDATSRASAARIAITAGAIIRDINATLAP